MRHLIVDGYNVVFGEPRYSVIAASDLDAARARLVEDVAVYAGRDAHAVVVFDGAGNPASDGVPHRVGAVAVVFSRAGVDADSVIEALAHRFRGLGRATVVVTSDAQTQSAVLGEGALRMSAAEFARELAGAREAVVEHASSGSSRSPLEDRIDPALRDRLARWARGR